MEMKVFDFCLQIEPIGAIDEKEGEINVLLIVTQVTFVRKQFNNFMKK